MTFYGKSGKEFGKIDKLFLDFKIIFTVFDYFFFAIRGPNVGNHASTEQTLYPHTFHVTIGIP